MTNQTWTPITEDNYEELPNTFWLATKDLEEPILYMCDDGLLTPLYGDCRQYEIESLVGAAAYIPVVMPTMPEL